MSNEEIVARIQAGENDLMGELWDRVERLIRWKANHAMLEREGYGGVQFWDLVNSGYFAMVAAVESFDPENGSFSTWLVCHLRNAFAEAMGIRTKRQRYDPINTAASLDAPLKDDEDGGQLSDLTPDPSGQIPIDAVEDAAWQEQLHEAMEAALSDIPKRYSETLRLRYYENKTLSEVAETSGISVEEARKRELRGLRDLRMPRYACQLRPFYESDFYCSSGLQSFRSSGMSAQERYLMVEEHRKKMAQDREMERRERENRAWETLLRKLEEDENARLEERGY